MSTDRRATVWALLLLLLLCGCVKERVVYVERNEYGVAVPVNVTAYIGPNGEVKAVDAGPSVFVRIGPSVYRVKVECVGASLVER